MKDLNEFRVAVDRIDERIVALLGERYDICRRVARHKKEKSIPMMQSGRVEQVKQRCASLAVEHDVSPEFVVQLYQMIIEEACRLEDQIIDSVA